MKVKVATNYLDCAHTSEIVCPYCGGEQGESLEYGKGEDIGTIECEHCYREFYASRYIEISYTSSPSDDSCGDWEKGAIFDDGIADIEEEEWANKNGVNECEIVKEEV